MTTAAIPTLTIYPAPEIKQAALDYRALKIVAQLQEAGFQAYLVGGCIRDILLGKVPKDFDIATNARPEEIAGLFRNCRLIGRRFRLAHIHFGREIIEVATFRAGSEQSTVIDKNGLVLEDNHYGTIEDDVIRRDFTINALYYDVGSHAIYDYLGAMEDIQTRTLRVIGDPLVRYAEDPVRMLRAARFAAKLDMQLDEQSQCAIEAGKENLRAVPPARLFDEAQKLFMSGYGEKSFVALKTYRLFSSLLPDAARTLSHPNQAFADYAEKMMRIALKNTDARIAANKPVTIAFLFAAFFWPVFQLQYQGLVGKKMNWHSAMHQAVDTVLIAAAERVAIPMRIRSIISEIWLLQARFELVGNSSKKIRSVLAQPRFRAAYDFLMIRVEAGEPLEALLEWWTDLQRNQSHDMSAQDAHVFEEHEGFSAARRTEKKLRRRYRRGQR